MKLVVVIVAWLTSSLLPQPWLQIQDMPDLRTCEYVLAQRKAEARAVPHVLHGVERVELRGLCVDQATGDVPTQVYLVSARRH